MPKPRHRSSGRHARRQPQRYPLPPAQSLLIERISHDGRGIAYWQGKSVFVTGALPGEEVWAHFSSHSARFAEAVAERILLASDRRIEPRCGHFGQCGGCQLQYVSAAEQLSIKQTQVLDQLSRLAAVVPEQVMPALSAHPWGYRQQARLGIWKAEAEPVVLGFRRRQSRELLDIEECPVLAPELAVLLAPLRELLLRWADASLTHLSVAQIGDDCGLTLRHTRSLQPGLVKALRLFAVEHGCQFWLQGSADAYGLTDLDGIAVDPRLYYTLPDFSCRFAVHPSDFMQINGAVNEQMVKQAIDWLAPQPHEQLLDLFCGLGNFTLPLARFAGGVIGVEATTAMVSRGEENAVLNGLEKVQFRAADLTRASVQSLLPHGETIDAMLLDPPRSGAREVCAQMSQLNPQRLLYVSCNPATLARDAGLLLDQGYHLQQLGILDMFPHTSHIETMALFVRQKRK